jgi:hypothetical protein
MHTSAHLFINMLDSMPDIKKQGFSCYSLMLVSCFTYSSALKMEVTCPFEKSIDSQRTTRRYIPQKMLFFAKCFGFRNTLCANVCFLLFI